MVQPAEAFQETDLPQSAVERIQGIGAYRGGLSLRESIQIRAEIVSRGEVGPIVAGVGINQGLFSSNRFTAVVVIVLITILVTPPILQGLFASDKQERKRLLRGDESARRQRNGFRQEANELCEKALNDAKRKLHPLLRNSENLPLASHVIIVRRSRSIHIAWPQARVAAIISERL
ncbi:MAG TPA: hypothetical protein VFR47_22485 [Anaerolineales bacterium]|nr:hypothetical protein [Anaerolineales bacterium]